MLLWKRIKTRPGGAVLALLLARRGVGVTLLEAHSDFNREFRGDTIHPSTLDLMQQLSLVDSLLEMPHIRVQTVTLKTRTRSIPYLLMPLRCTPDLAGPRLRSNLDPSSGELRTHRPVCGVPVRAAGRGPRSRRVSTGEPPTNDARALEDQRLAADMRTTPRTFTGPLIYQLGKWISPPAYPFKFVPMIDWVVVALGRDW